MISISAADELDARSFFSLNRLSRVYLVEVSDVENSNVLFGGISSGFSVFVEDRKSRKYIIKVPVIIQANHG